MNESTKKQTNEKATISPERRDRFTWKPGDLKFFSDRKELEEHAKKHGEKIIWYK